MTSLLDTLPRTIGLMSSLRKRLPVLFDISNVTKNPWVPPLFLLINPSTLEKQSTKKVSTQKTRSGICEYHWGDELDTFSATGSTGGFYLPYWGLASGSKKPLLNRTSSIAYLNFLNLLDLYRSNGLVYDDYGNPVESGSIKMTFDTGSYLGYFSDFSFEEIDEKPFKFDINFTFKVQKTVVVFSPGSPI